MRRARPLLSAAVLAGVVFGARNAPAAQVITHTVGQLTVLADPSAAYPGGLLILHLRRPLGTVFAILNGRRAPFLDTAAGPRALVPIPIGTPPGTATLGIEVWARRGRQRVAMDVPIAARSYGVRSVVIPEAKRGLLARREATTDGRRLLLTLRSVAPQALWTASFVPPVAAAPLAVFGESESYVGGTGVDQLTDGTFGEYHRGVDYEVAAGSVVVAPAPGTVAFAGPLTLSGQTVVIDHGQGVVSVLFHLGRIDVHEADHVEAHTPVGLSGETGIAASPHVHWGVYVHGVAVDPAVLQATPVP
jgi:hypothetical protein